jgi:hypothetical protein
MTPTLRRAARRAALGAALALGGTLAVAGGAGPASAATLIRAATPPSTGPASTCLPPT